MNNPCSLGGNDQIHKKCIFREVSHFAIKTDGQANKVISFGLESRNFNSFHHRSFWQALHDFTIVPELLYACYAMGRGARKVLICDGYLLLTRTFLNPLSGMKTER